MSQVAEKKDDKCQDRILETLEALKTEVAQVKSQLKERSQATEQANPPQVIQETRNERKNTPKCSQCQASGEARCFHCYIFVEVITIRRSWMSTKQWPKCFKLCSLLFKTVPETALEGSQGQL